MLTGSLDKTARLWDAATGKELRAFKGHGSYVYSVAFSPDGKRVLTGSFDKHRPPVGRRDGEGNSAPSRDMRALSCPSPSAPMATAC